MWFSIAERGGQANFKYPSGDFAKRRLFSQASSGPSLSVTQRRPEKGQNWTTTDPATA